MWNIPWIYAFSCTGSRSWKFFSLIRSSVVLYSTFIKVRNCLFFFVFFLRRRALSFLMLLHHIKIIKILCNYEKIEIDYLLGITIPFTDVLKSLNFEQLFGVTFFLLSNIIFSNIIYIVFILYGDHLIKKFKLEEKYPRLAKWIQLRRRLQRYYLIMSIGYIIICSLLIMGTALTIFIMFSYKT